MSQNANGRSHASVLPRPCQEKRPHPAALVRHKHTSAKYTALPIGPRPPPALGPPVKMSPLTIRLAGPSRPLAAKGAVDSAARSSFHDMASRGAPASLACRNSIQSINVMLPSWRLTLNAPSARSNSMNPPGARVQVETSTLYTATPSLETEKRILCQTIITSTLQGWHGAISIAQPALVVFLYRAIGSASVPRRHVIDPSVR